MTARQYVGCIGLLAALFACVTQGCTNPPKLPSVAQVSRVVSNARNVSDKTCDKSQATCLLYFDAVKTGLLPEDTRAELACARVGSVCSLLGAAGAAN